MIELAERREPIDLVTLKAALKREGELEDVGGPAYLASLVDGVQGSTNVVQYARIVEKKAALRALVNIRYTLQAAAASGAEDPARLLDTIEGAISGARARLLPDARPRRHVGLLPATAIEIRPVRRLWDNRMALGSFGLLGGREGIGKSIADYTLAADVTTGCLPGVYHGTPQAVVIVATEDSTAHTIVPRLMAAGADLTRIHFVAVVTADGADTDLVLPVDVPELARVIREVRAALVLFDPLLSRLDAASIVTRTLSSARASPAAWFQHDMTMRRPTVRVVLAIFISLSCAGIQRL